MTAWYCETGKILQALMRWALRPRLTTDKAQTNASSGKWLRDYSGCHIDELSVRGKEIREAVSEMSSFSFGRLSALAPRALFPQAPAPPPLFLTLLRAPSISLWTIRCLSQSGKRGEAGVCEIRRCARDDIFSCCLGDAAAARGKRALETSVGGALLTHSRDGHCEHLRGWLK